MKPNGGEMLPIRQLIINSAYSEPAHHWRPAASGISFEMVKGRRPAGYTVSAEGASPHNDPGKFVELGLVNAIRPKVAAWREAGYPGATGVTRKLLAHWRNDEARPHPFFWCQLDAIETLIWLSEAPAQERDGIVVPGDGGLFRRLCTKLCTGGGKTIVMAMLIAWQVCNRASYPRDGRFSGSVFIVAPGLTVKSRLQVLKPSDANNYYSLFNVAPPGMQELLRRAKVVVENWQQLAWETEESVAKRKSVDKRGPKSLEAYAREALGDLANERGILVINDEAHHAWRVPEAAQRQTGLSREEKEEEKEATIWIGGLDRIHEARGILTCYDFSATPFVPSGKNNSEEALFNWIVSDFGLYDGIEAGIVKTPRIVVRDDSIPNAKTYRPRLEHIYIDKDVRDDLKKKGRLPQDELPKLVCDAYRILCYDWKMTFDEWKGAGKPEPPVLITVVNSTETAERVKYAFDAGRVGVEELCEPDMTLHIDTKTIEKDDTLREKADTVGQMGKPGEKIRNVISVAMLSEGWDTKTVTHVLGLRAFSSQLLCEQVIGRGLRRTSYEIDPETGLFPPEYVNIFGIPFRYLPHEEEGSAPRPPSPKTAVESLPHRSEYQISWPNVLRLDRVVKPRLTLDTRLIETLTLNADATPLRAELGWVIDGRPDQYLGHSKQIDLEKYFENYRLQHQIFEMSARVFDKMKAPWQDKAAKLPLLGQVMGLVEEFLASNALEITPPLFNQDPVRRRVLILSEMQRIVEHLWGFILPSQTVRVAPVLDQAKRVRSTADMPTWYTGRPCQPTVKSQISQCVFDSAWEASEAYRLEASPHVAAWAKNDHLGFEVDYYFEGKHSYRPDFLVRLRNGAMLILETKGQESDRDRAKRRALKEWVDAVNGLGEYGTWRCDVSRNAADVEGILERHAGGK